MTDKLKPQTTDYGQAPHWPILPTMHYEGVAIVPEDLRELGNLVRSGLDAVAKYVGFALDSANNNSQWK